MLQNQYPTAPRPHTRRARPQLSSLFLLSSFCFLLSPAHAQFDTPTQDFLQNVHSTTRPAELAAPTPTTQPKPPAEARPGTLTLSDGNTYQGQIWTTLATPLRIWDESTKTYQDLDFALIDHLEAVVDDQKMEPEWRWLKEGSDVKVYSGKSYPNLTLHYKFTIPDNNPIIEGTTVAPIFMAIGPKTLNLALYTKLKGNPGQALTDLIYIKSITFSAPATQQPIQKKTTKLPLLPD